MACKLWGLLGVRLLSHHACAAATAKTARPWKVKLWQTDDDDDDVDDDRDDHDDRDDAGPWKVKRWQTGIVYTHPSSNIGLVGFVKRGTTVYNL